MDANYFFIDGSALSAQVRQLRRARPQFRARKLLPQVFIDYLMSELKDFHGNNYKRAVFYFPQGDLSVSSHLVLPDYKCPGELRDIHFRYCGHKLKGSAEFDAWAETNVPERFKDRITKSEKGIDIEICCEALRLASAGRLDRLFILTNDSDFVPLARTLKTFGANISLIHLSTATNANVELLREVDSYHVVGDESLEGLFSPVVNIAGVARLDAERLPDAHDKPASEKPDAEPSDLNFVDNPDRDE